VLVTRPPPGGAELAALLEAEGIPALLCPAVEIAPPEDAGPLNAAAARAARGGYDWVVFTSARGVLSLARTLAVLDPQGAAPRARVAAVGAATAAAAAAEGWTVALVPDVHTSEGLLEALARESSLEGASVLLPVAERAGDVLPEGLRARGARVEVVVAYRTLARGDQLEGVRSLVREAGTELVVFASPSAVESFREALGGDALSLRAVVIGPVTARAAEHSGFQVVAVADPHTNAGLLRAVKGSLGPAGPGG
jgi:uroporphyrinogen-III synthase